MERQTEAQRRTGPGRSPSVREVAERAGVAMSSVSRVLSDHPDVSPAMRARVLPIVEELGYQPNLLASSLRRGLTMTVGFMVRDISNPLFSLIALGAETELREHGYGMILTNSEGSPKLDVTHINLFRRRRVDGLLLSLTDETDPAVLAQIASLDAAFVLIDRELKTIPDASAVLCDHVSAVSEVVQYLHGLGHRRIGLIAGSPALRPAREMVRGFEETCTRLGVEPLSEGGAFSEQHGRDAADRMTDSRNPPTAIISGANQILPGVLRSIREHNLSIPEDISLVTFDGLPILDFIDPPIGNVSRDAVAMGRASASLLLKEMANGGSGRIDIPFTFDPRGSCSPPSGASSRPRRAQPGEET